jgi:anti-sigma regulatory factor (Ser/Thr protein kinase)
MTSAERSIALPAELTSVRQGRLFARDVVREWQCDGLADDVQLAVSELITNAVRHAGTDVVLTLRLADELRVEVRDSHAELIDRTPQPPDDPFATSGRGLHIVAAVSSEWGVTAFEGGKSVWFTLTLPDSHGADADVFAMSDHRADDTASQRAESDERDGGERQSIGMRVRTAN